MSDHFYAVIMAGGSGTRLWPLSRRKRPKQMLSLFDERTLFQTSVQRLNGLIPPERVLVVTVAELANELHQQSPEIPEQNFLIEPMPKGTASVVGLAAVALDQRDPQAIMAVLTADHYIGNETRFRQLLEAARDVARQDYLVTLGIEPTFAATGFGYIKYGEELDYFQKQKVFKVLGFKEKPEEEQAKKMLAAGNYAWNSGMFVWSAKRILDEFEKQMPQLARSLHSIESVWTSPQAQNVIDQLWVNLESQTIDYGVMEGAENVVVIPAEGLEWSDVGSWDSLFEVIHGDEDGNIVMGGAHVGIDTHRSLVYVYQEHRLIVTIGVDDLVVVDTGDVLLVCRKDQAQKVRQVVDRLKKEGREYL